LSVNCQVLVLVGVVLVLESLVFVVVLLNITHCLQVPHFLDNPGKSLIYFSKISRTWKVLENEIGPGKSWKLKCRVLEFNCGSN